MASTPTQTSRIASLTTPLGTDKLVLTAMNGSEGMSELFEFTVEAYSTDPDLDFNKAIGQDCSVAVKNYKGVDRKFSGILTSASWIGRADEYQAYRLVLRPWFWLLTRSSDCRIFVDKTVPDIIHLIFAKHSFSNAQFKLTTTYPVIKYCVQYRETDHNFVCRLMEEFGIYYYFDHSGAKHSMILADSLSGHSPKANGEKLIYRPGGARQRRDDEQLSSWVAGRNFNAGKITLADYDFKKPGAKLQSENESGAGYENDKLERFDFPGRFKDSGKGDLLSRVRLEAEQARDHRCRAKGDAISCVPGFLAELSGHSEASQNVRYLVVRADHRLELDTYRSSNRRSSDQHYSAEYEYLPTSVPFRAPVVTPKPIVHGPQTAVVVGSGEIDVDKDGCIMVQFYWDREKQQSRRVRIAQAWSGNGWGGIFIPRVGQEVVVQFVEGDPDRPLVIGTVYNGDNNVPYKLPGMKNIAGFKSNTTEGGGGFNEFVFDDSKGSELVRMHAQKDLGAVIENDESREVKNDVKIKVGQDQELHVGNVLKIEAGQKIELTVAQSKITMDGMGITIEAPTITIKADMKLDASSPLTTVKGDGILVLQGGLVKIN